MYLDFIKTPIGLLKIVASQTGITSLNLTHKEENTNASEITRCAQKELDAYFAGSLKSFSVPLDLTGGSDFFRSVWDIVYAIPYGSTRSYMDIARELENTGAIRAVGMANAKNPIPVIVPCHRVIGSDGSLTGYALGMEIKRQLLMLENPQVFGMQGKLAFN